MGGRDSQGSPRTTGQRRCCKCLEASDQSVVEASSSLGLDEHRKTTAEFVLGLCYPPGVSTASPVNKTETPTHTAIVRVTHWITVVSFLALLISGTEIVVSHPRFYWGEVGNALTPPMFTIPIPASRATVPTGYGFVMPDQNGWSRYLHFEAAWVVLLTGLVYAISGLFAGHFRNNLFPVRADRNWAAFRGVFAKYLRRAPPDELESHSYNVVQRILCQSRPWSFLLYLGERR